MKVGWGLKEHKYTQPQAYDDQHHTHIWVLVILLLCCITLPSFNRITFTNSNTRIIYLLFFPPFIFNLHREDTSSVCQVTQSEGEEERGSVMPVQRSPLCFNKVRSVNTLRLPVLRRSSAACDTEEHITGERLHWRIDRRSLTPLKHFNVMDMKASRLVLYSFVRSNTAVL